MKHLLKISLSGFNGISDAHLDLMDRHWTMVKQWNQRTNLTAIINDQEASWLHYCDSLQALPVLIPGSIIDIGSGGGFPGIPLSIVTGIETALLEPRQKRVSFLQTAVARLDLPHVDVILGKSTDAPMRLFDNAVTRATFSSIYDLRGCMDWVRPGGHLIALQAINAADIEGAHVQHYTMMDRKRKMQIVKK